MKEINCNIIKDILPLYVDGVVSDDTKEMVEEHLEHCEECKKEIELMKQELYIPVEKEASFIKNFKKKWRNKKIIISVLSILLTGLILFGAFSFIFHYDRVIP
jgi:predicted anti-sigma-YlaC factor YlaD